MKNKKLNRIITSSVIGVLVFVAVIIIVLNYTGEDSKLTLIEKKWITSNANKVVDVNVFNDIPVYGNGGNGVVFDFLNSFTSEYGIEFNKISYYNKNDNVSYGDFSFKVLNNQDVVTEEQILFYEDCYVIVGGNIISDINEIGGKIGVLSEDKNDVVYYLEISEDSLIEYKNIEEILKAYKDKEITNFVVPNIMYMNDIVSNQLNIVYHVSDISKKYVLEVKDDNLYSIMNKYFIEYQETSYDQSFSNQFLDVYFKNSEYSEVDRVNYNSSVYTYGYVVNMPYENVDGNDFVGVISNYLKEFQSIAQVDFKIVKYDTIEDLKAALLVGDVDFAFGNLDTNSLGSSFNLTNPVVDFEYVVLSKDYENIRNITGLKGKEISVVSGSKLDNLLKSKGISVKGYNDTDELMRGIDDSSIILMDRNMYNYYKDGKLKDYNLIYEDSGNGTSFVISGKNKVFTSLFSYYVAMRDYHDFRYDYHTAIGVHDNKIFEIIGVIVFCLLLTLVLFIVSLIMRKKNNKKNKSVMDDKMKFIDVMTSLKNRNYLNYSIPKWDENVIYPQAIVVADLNNLKDINDNYGHEKGDEVIKIAANILIANQLEKTDLVRTDGNEFLIYMVGYSREDVCDYARKIYKKFKELPYGYGASIGYSMIEDDIKTIDDAINEAVIDMRKNKDNIKK